MASIQMNVTWKELRNAYFLFKIKSKLMKPFAIAGKALSYIYLILSGHRMLIRNLCFRLQNKIITGNEDPKDYQNKLEIN
jgi:hypothetical protein